MTDQKRSPLAFMSYVRFDDAHEDGKLTKFRERLSHEVRMQSGREFSIFQDHADIKVGQDWKQRIDESLDGAKFLIAIITPSFFNSHYCRYELQRFFEREQRLGRNDLIFPVYYVNYPFLHDETRLAQDELAKKLMTRQFTDWRELRHEEFTSRQGGRMLERLAVQIRDAIERDHSPGTATGQMPPTERTGGAEKAVHVDGRASSGSENARSETIAAKSVQSPADQIIIPTLIVDQLHRGNYTTIAEAIKAATPGARIIVRPGLYEEGLVIGKPLEIVGDGEVGYVVIRAVGKNVILFKTNMGRISNLTLRQDGGGEYYGVDIAQGRLELEGCDISSQSLSCVAIHGSADPRLRHNRIHDGKQSGVYVYENGQGMLEDNDIFGNANSGVAIKNGGNPTIRGNHIRDGKAGGVYVYESGQGMLEDNDIFGNAYAGVAIKSGGNPTLRKNRINRNAYEAIWIYDKGHGLIEDNDLRDNAMGAWDISADSKANVKRARNLE
jgi:F-box protein 11